MLEIREETDIIFLVLIIIIGAHILGIKNPKDFLVYFFYGTIPALLIFGSVLLLTFFIMNKYGS